MPDVLRIAIIGPEASGKTELAKKLAAHFGAGGLTSIATEEFARLYFADKKLAADHVLTVDEMREVMQGQRLMESRAASRITADRGIVWIDASTINGPLYSGMKIANGELTFDLYGVDPEVMDYAAHSGYDAFVLCEPHENLPWVDDGMRAMPELAHRRKFASGCKTFAGMYYRSAPVITVDAATWEMREKQAIDALSRLLMGH